MNKYPEYKDSGVVWIGEIPSHWEMKKFKYLFSLKGGEDPKKIQNDEGDYPILGTGGEIDRGNEYLYDQKTLLLGRKGTIDRPFLFNGPFWVSDVMYYTVQKKDMTPDYLSYLFETFPFDYYVYGSTQPSMSSLDYEGHFFPVPPQEEQDKILKFLDVKTKVVESLVEKHLKKIELLKEQKISLINKVVTKGLNPDVEMKDSGVEWIGEIPSHWEVKKLKYIVEHVSNKSTPEEGDIKISPENVESNTGKCFDFYSDYLGDGHKFISGDILLNKLRIYLKKILLVDYDGFSMGEMIVLRTPSKKLSRFLFYVFFNDQLIGYLNSLSTGVKVPRVSPDNILSTKFPIPPVKETQEINNNIFESNLKTDNLISKEEKRIELLKEYKQSLISEVVTGKIKIFN